MDQYPAVRLMVAHGGKLAVVMGFVLPVLALIGIMAAHWHWVWAVVALPLGVGLGFAFRLLAELTQIIADMLLPH